MKTKHLAVLCACLAMALPPLASAQKYHAFIWNNGTGMTDLGTLGGNTSYALGINDSGEVVGYSYLADNVTRHAFTWTAAGGMVDLGTPPGDAWSQGEGINSSGAISGEAAVSNTGRVKQAPLFWSPANGFQSPTTARVGSNLGLAINDRGAITGAQYDTDGLLKAYIWNAHSPTVTFLPFLPGGLTMVGYGINNRNDVVGNCNQPPNGTYVAFFWSQQTGTINIGQIAGADSTLASGINDRDEVAGIAYFDFGTITSGFYWRRGLGFVNLQTLGGDIGAGLCINLTGAIVGWSSVASGSIHATEWNNYTSTPIDLGTLPGGTDSYARGVNASGQVAGYSTVP